MAAAVLGYTGAAGPAARNPAYHRKNLLLLLPQELGRCLARVVDRAHECLPVRHDVEQPLGCHLRRYLRGRHPPNKTPIALRKAPELTGKILKLAGKFVRAGNLCRGSKEGDCSNEIERGRWGQWRFVANRTGDGSGVERDTCGV